MDIPPAPQPQPQPNDDPAARFKPTAPKASPEGSQGGALPVAETRKGLPGPVWFLLGALTASAGWYGYGLMQRAMVRSMASTMGQAATMDPQMQEFMRQAQQTAAAVSSDAGQAAPQGGSSLDLVGAPGSVSGTGQPVPPPVAIDPKKIEALGNASADLVGSLMPLLNDPAMQRMDPAARQQAAQLTGMLQQLQTSMRTGKPIDPKAQAEFMRTIQQLQQQQQQSRKVPARGTLGSGGQ